MKKRILNGKAVPRWVILLIDLVIISWSFSLSYFVIKQFEFPVILRGHFVIYTGLYCLISLLIFYSMRIHTGLIRYSNLQDILRIFSAVLLSSIIFPVINQLIVVSILHVNTLPISKVLLINFFVSSSLLIMLRSGVKGVYYYVKSITSSGKERVLIYGSDSSAVLIKRAIQSGNNDRFIIVGFIDPDRHLTNSYIEQVKVYDLKHLPMLKAKRNVNKLILMNEQLGSKEKQVVIEQCLRLDIKVLTVPPSDQWIYGRLSLKQIQDLKIEDLLQREPIVINNHKISSELSGKRILITGAAGSIGSEIVRQILLYEPEMIILCDQAESDLHDIQLEIQDKYPELNVTIFIANIRNLNRMMILFKLYRPQIIFHAAAYKHVPMMESHPSEAILTNVMGTKNVADLAILYEAEKFVMISTDKAVNPTNIMGTSKRIAEMYVQSLNNALDNIVMDNLFNINNPHNSSRLIQVKNSQTKFITTRFGNVLGSNGSVIPRFRAQIQMGGPLTVTHPEITRYFMTIPEAVQLVLEAGIMGKGGEIFVFDMGKPVKIMDLALNMIKLAGLTKEKDISIVITGLRPGEKLYEELLNEKEKTIPTHHEKIKIAKIISCSYHKVMNDIEELIRLCDQEDNNIIVKKMKDMVPEFISKNSRYEELDFYRTVDNKAVV